MHTCTAEVRQRMSHRDCATLAAFRTCPHAFCVAVQSAASQSQHVVNILAAGDPVNDGDVDKVEEKERANNNTGLLQKGGPTAKVQVCKRSAHLPFRLFLAHTHQLY